MAQGRRPRRRPRAVRGLRRDSQKPAAPAAPKAAAGFLPGQVSFGVLAPLSGPHGERGRDLVDGARMAVADLNVRGGVNGQRVGIVAEDDGCEASAGRAGARRLREREIAGALGGICASAAGAAARTLGTGLPFLVTSANAPRHRQRPAHADGVPDERDAVPVGAGHRPLARVPDRAAALRRDRGRSRLALPRPSRCSGCRRRPRRRSREQAVPAGTTDWSTTVKAALAGDPDFVYWAGSAAGGGSLLAALRDGRLRRRVRRLRGVREPGVPGRRRRGGGGRVRDRARQPAEPARGGGLDRALHEALRSRARPRRAAGLRGPARAGARRAGRAGRSTPSATRPSWRGSTRATRRSSAARRCSSRPTTRSSSTTTSR